MLFKKAGKRIGLIYGIFVSANHFRSNALVELSSYLSQALLISSEVSNYGLRRHLCGLSTRNKEVHKLVDYASIWKLFRVGHKETQQVSITLNFALSFA